LAQALEGLAHPTEREKKTAKIKSAEPASRIASEKKSD
jgi:hypothetical protein